MIRKNTISLISASVLLLASSSSYGSSNLPTSGPAVDDVEVAHLSKNCSGIANCATTFQELLDWIWNTRNPSAASPLMVDIAPGTHIVPAQKICDGSGNVTFRGSGKSTTVLTGGGTIGGYQQTVIAVYDCESLAFQDMTIQTGQINSGTGSTTVVDWQGNGSSEWINVDMQSAGAGWYGKSGTDTSPGPKHNFHSCFIKITPVPNTLYPSATAVLTANYGDMNFYGSEISVINKGVSAVELYGISATGEGANVNLIGS